MGSISGSSIKLWFGGCLHTDDDTPSNSPFSDADSDLASASIAPDMYFAQGDFFSLSVSPALPTHQSSANLVKTDMAGGRKVPFMALGNHDAGDGNMDWWLEASSTAFASPSHTISEADADRRRYYVDTGNLRVYQLGTDNDAEYPAGKTNTSETNAGGHPMGTHKEANFRWFLASAVANRDRILLATMHNAQMDTFSWTDPGEGNLAGYHGSSGIREFAATMSCIEYSDGYQDIGTSAYRDFFDRWPIFELVCNSHTHINQTVEKDTVSNGTRYRHIGVLHPSTVIGEEWSTIVDINGNSMSLKTFAHDPSGDVIETAVHIMDTVFDDAAYTPTAVSTPSAISFSSVTAVDDESIRLEWTTPLAALIVRREGSAPSGTPASDTAYIANRDSLGTGEVVFWGLTSPDSSGNNRVFIDNRNLKANTTYHYAIFACDAGGGAIRYSATAGTGSATTSTETTPGLVDRFNSTTIDSGKWTTTNPDSMIVPVRGSVNFVNVTTSGFGVNYIRSIDNYSSGVVALEGVMNFDEWHQSDARPMSMYLGDSSQSFRARIKKQHDKRGRSMRLQVDSLETPVYQAYVDTVDLRKSRIFKVTHTFSDGMTKFWWFDRVKERWVHVGGYALAVAGGALYAYFSNNSGGGFPNNETGRAHFCAFGNRDWQTSYANTTYILDGFTQSDSRASGNTTSLSAYGAQDTTLSIVFTTGSDVSTDQTIFESGGTSNGIHLWITNSGELHLDIGDAGNDASLDTMGGFVEANTQYAAVVSVDWTGGTYRVFLRATDSASKVTVADEVRYATFDSTIGGTSWCGSDGTGVGQINNNRKNGTGGGTFLGTIDSNLLIYANQRV